ncbi:ComF family protein [Candidatus Giovannonibacteria bacterium]|nr:ComF family protein [Candidatus Giovannonibacteria bacterium]
MFKLIHTGLDNFFSLLFPERCIGCLKEKVFLCELCIKKAKKESEIKNPGPFLDKLYSFGFYDNRVLKRAIRRFKYHGTARLSHPFSQMLHHLFRTYLTSETNAVLLPIPISKKRLRKRGYNQAELISKALSDRTGIENMSDIILKVKDTPTQTALSSAKRISNVINSFRISTSEKIAGRTVFLIDDISTTGATLNEAARVLKDAGAKKVIGLVIARG